MFLLTDDYFLPCLNKSLFGVDCPGCGIQRAFMHLIRGEFLLAYKMYPAIYTLLLFGLFLVINFNHKFKNSRKIIVTFTTVNLVIILINYYIKMKPIFTI